MSPNRGPAWQSVGMDRFLEAAIDEARAGLAEGGIPIGSVLVLDGEVIGRGHNRRVQKGSAVLHAEMDALEDAGRLPARDYRVVVGENRTFRGPEDYVRARGVEVEIVDDPACVQMMQDFISARPDLWNEDIGV